MHRLAVKGSNDFAIIRQTINVRVLKMLLPNEVTLVHAICMDHKAVYIREILSLEFSSG